jgi:DNA polymerase
MRTLSKKRIEALKWLDKNIQSCTRCRLFTEGRAKPYWTKYSRYVIVGEAPWTEEVSENTPFVGTTGKLLRKILVNFNLKRRQFLIINSVNCKPSYNPTNKPFLGQIQLCHSWINMYIKAVRPEKMILLGNYAVQSITGEKGGILQKVGMKINYFPYVDRSWSIPAILSIHPSYLLYNRKDGLSLIKRAIKEFKALKK